jgi:hypothetical protein
MTNDLTIPNLTNLTTAHRVHIALILDRSGSMGACRGATINGFNHYLTHVRGVVDEATIPATGTLTVFADAVEVQQFLRPLSELQLLTPATYVPDGCTALLDAVGITVSRLEESGTLDDSYLVCVVSDGYENASTQYSSRDIASTIGRLTESGNWTFTYLGANQDLSVVVEDLNIPTGNVASYTASPAGTSEAWTRQAAATRRTMHHMSRGGRSSHRFFVDDDTDGSPLPPDAK